MNRGNLTLCSRDCCLEYFVWVCRFWGIITAVGLWGIGVESAFRADPLGIYLLCVAGVLSFLETVFIISICIYLCTKDEQSHCVRCWNGILWFDNWKRGLLYLLLSIGCFIKPKTAWLAVISGVMLVICGIFYCIKTYKARLQEQIETKRGEEANYDRFEIIEDEDDFDDDDDITQPLPQDMQISLQTEAVIETVAGQDEILEV